MLLPGFGDAMLAFCVGKLREHGARPVQVNSDAVVQESAGVNLSERFLGRAISEVLERVD